MEGELWQAALVEQAKLEQRYSVLDHADMKRYVNGIVNRLWLCVESDLPIMQVRLLADSKADAYVFPNGVCYITSGMLGQTCNSSQLAMILAHEIIHYTHRHAVLMNYQSQQSHWINHAIPANSNNSGDMSSLLDQAEQQADAQGLELITHAGYCPTAAADIMTYSRHPGGTVKAEGGRLDPLAAKSDHIKRIAPALKANARQGLQLGTWESAENNIDRYLAVFPDDAQGHYIRGEIRRLRPGRDKSGTPETAYQKAIELDRAFAPAYQSLGIILFQKGRMAQAKRFFEQSLALASDTDQAAYIKHYLQWCSQ
jgi:predicted Zn-dependent protease